METLESPVIRLTENAANQIAHMLGEESKNKGLRIYVNAGGCSGLNYEMELNEAKPGDEKTKQYGVFVFIDPKASPFLKGSIIDYSDSLTSTGFQIRNPNAKQTCGCGKSFEA